jgi:hypothetical protein
MSALRRLNLPVTAVTAILTVTLGLLWWHPADVRAHRSRSLSLVRRAAETVGVSTTSVTPAYLPAGATLVSSMGDDAASLRENQYQLAGAANANTVPPNGPDDTTALTTHPASVLSVTFVRGVAVVPTTPVDPDYFTIREVTVGGLPAVLSWPKSGFGAQRVDWLDSAGYHVVLCDRLNTADGISGVTPTDLLRVADSLYT